MENRQRHILSFVLFLVLLLLTFGGIAAIQYHRIQDFNDNPPQEKRWSATVITAQGYTDLKPGDHCTIRQRVAMECTYGCSPISSVWVACNGEPMFMLAPTRVTNQWNNLTLKNGQKMMWDTKKRHWILSTPTGTTPQRLALEHRKNPKIWTDTACRAEGVASLLAFSNPSPDCTYTFLKKIGAP